jgi:hypothetical protein
MTVRDSGRPFDEATARAALIEAAGRGGLPVTGVGYGPDHGLAGGPRLIRIGSNAVFDLAGGVVAKVTPPAAGWDDAEVADDAADDAERAVADVRRTLDVARWLERVGFPSTRAVPADRLAAEQPIEVAGYLVSSGWRIGDGDAPRHGSTGDLGRLLRAFHELPLPDSIRPAPIDPVGRARGQLTRSLPSGEQRATLLDRLDLVAQRYRELTFPLPPGHLHGDATVANVVLDREGRPTMIDLDLVRSGPREWDLIRTATYAYRLGWHTPAEYRAFCAGYSVDVAAWAGFPVLADLSELLQVAWLAQAAVRRPELSAELSARTATLRDGTSRHGWRAI